MQDVHVKLNPGLPWQKQPSTTKDTSETSEVLHLEQLRMALKLGHFGK